MGFTIIQPAVTAAPKPATRDLRSDHVHMTMPEDLLAHNRKLIEEFRADGGKSMGDRQLLLLTTVGRKSGEERTSPMMYVRTGHRILVIASNNGACEDPLWYRNLLAEPTVTVELAGETVRARATPLTGDEYEREWAAIKSRHPFFAEHETRSGKRRIPVVALTPTPLEEHGPASASGPGNR